MLKRVFKILLPVLVFATQIGLAQQSRPSGTSGTSDIRLKPTGVLLLDLDATGNVVQVRMLESTGYRVLDEASMKVYSKKKFKPHTRSPLTVPIRFSVRSGGR
jgi:TonB family protein